MSEKPVHTVDAFDDAAPPSEARTEPPGLAPGAPASPSRFSRTITWMLALGLAGGVAASIGLGDPFGLFYYPGDMVVRVYDGRLDVLAAAVERQPALAWMVDSPGADVAHAREETIEAYGELLSYWERADPTMEQTLGGREERDHVRAHLAVTLLERGRPEAARDVVAAIDAGRRPSVIRLLAAAYPDLDAVPDDLDGAVPEPWTIFRWGWAARRVGQRLAAAGAAPAAFGFPADAATLNAVPALASVVAETAVVLVVILCGVGGLVLAWKRGSAWSRIGDASAVAPWSGAAAWAVVVRGLALGMVAGIVWQLVWDRYGTGGWAPWGTAVGLLPVVLLASRRLLRPCGLSWARAFGVPARSGTEVRLVVLAAAAFAGVALGTTAVHTLVHAADVHLHWTDTVLEHLLLGGPTYRGLGVIEAVLLAPVLEEMIVRGVLYPTLRRRWAPWVAATASGVVFAAAHGYGLHASLLLVWSGVVLALAYERSGTLLVPIIVHVANNGLSMLGHLRMS